MKKFSSLTLVVVLFFVSACTKTTYETQFVQVAQNPVVIAKNPDMPEIQVLAPGSGGQVARYVVQNTSSTDTATVTFVTLGVKGSPGNVYNYLSVSTDGSNVNIDSVKASNKLANTIDLVPGQVSYLNVSLGTNIKDTGFVQTSLQVTASWKGRTDTTVTLLGQKSLFKLPVITDISLGGNFSPQYIASANGVVDGITEYYQVVTDGNTGVQISDIDFAVVGQNAATSVKVNGQVFPFINGIAHATNVHIWSWGGITVSYSYPSVGSGGVPSGTKSQVILTKVIYSDGIQKKTFIANVAGSINVLVASTPLVTVFTPSSTLTTGLVEAIDIDMKANAQGFISFDTFSVRTAGDYGVTIGSANNIVVTTVSGIVIPTTKTPFDSYGQTTISFNTKYQIPAGTTARFRVFVPVTSVFVSGTVYLNTTLTTTNFVFSDGNKSFGDVALIKDFPSFFTSRVSN